MDKIKRPICIIDGCDNLAQRYYKHKDGSDGYRKLCALHYRKKYLALLFAIIGVCTEKVKTKL